MAFIPMTIELDPDEPEAGELFVDGTVGDRPYRFLLDTGAAITRLVADSYMSRFDSTDQASSLGVIAGNRDDLITIPSLQLGPIARFNITVARAAAGGMVRINLIGMDILKDFRLHFDFARNRLGIDPGDGLTQDAAFHEVKMDSRFHPYFAVQFGATAADAVWDSGASLTVVDSAFVARHPAHFLAAGQSSGTDSTGSEATTSMYVMTEATIGGRLFPPARVAAVDLSAVNSTLETPMNLILGYSTIRHANWLLDFPMRRWAFLKA